MAADGSSGQEISTSTPLELPTMAVLSTRVANQEPVATVSTPVSVLRYEPAVDVQARSFAEGQADIAIRGGTFANTGFVLSGLPLYDPQTAHYTSELPIAPAMLATPKIAVGTDLAMGGGWNATAGAIDYGWGAVRPGGAVAVSAGEWGSRRVDLTAGAALGHGWAMDVGVAYSESDGPFANADHEIARYSARLQHTDERSATNLAVGYEDKFFGWPNLYTPFNSPETEDIQTLLIVATHRVQVDDAADGFVEFGGYFRQNDDNYAFNRFAPVGPIPPYQHTSRVTAAGGRGRWNMSADTRIDARVWVLADNFQSTSLRYGKFYSRTHFTAGLYGTHTLALNDAQAVEFTGGAGIDDTNRGSDAITPVVDVAWSRPNAVWSKVALGYSAASQAPSYTAVAGNPNAGLFRGNSSLDRATSRTLDLRGEFAGVGWVGSVSLFHRWDDDLVDWTFRQGVIARSAAAVGLETTGVELLARRSWQDVDLVFGYSWLTKDADYGAVVVDGSFYALNFPDHRITAALIWRAAKGFEIRLDNELRWQEPNVLRLNGTEDAALSSLGVYWTTPWARSLQLSLQVDNMWNSDFEEIPATPASPRQVAVGARWRW